MDQSLPLEILYTGQGHEGIFYFIFFLFAHTCEKHAQIQISDLEETKCRREQETLAGLINCLTLAHTNIDHGL